MFDPECTICCIAGSAQCALHCEKDIQPMKNDALTTIKPAIVERDENGYWTHPDFPDFGETIPNSEIAHWLCENQIGYVTQWMEYDAPEDVSNKYFEEGDPDISGWNPECNIEGAFLLSVHDTEDGPVALFAHPCQPLTATGQLKAGDSLIIQGKSKRDSQFAKVVEVLDVDGREEILIDKKKNYFFATDMLLAGKSWAAFVQVARWR